ncbi:LPXTG cell wall anchor domain-containing protein [Streptomyces spirodelae]|uniref:LPXTG cell wall anchor domain-containing protein n=1 Tax=Streptomyces spirodelae TaxID=2812904 RepID=A0ABS3WWM2_9ACTN|nr:LPXTG cell wall anchor domain-containing protein [Streptomyces spirodelae]MBO8187458.1 LPXTG cell wall anchor domain-containing protein [Streptomyces spirodelae]
MRTFSSACTVVAGVAVSLLVAPVAQATPPGDNGTVKIHDAKTGEMLRKNQPHVCTFYLDAFGFDGRQQVDWRIVEMPPTGTKGTVAKSDSLALDGEGHGRSADLTLPDGHYKLIWNFDGEHGRAKHKVFWADCEGDKEPGGDPSGSPSGSPSDGPSEKPSAEPSKPAASTSASPSASTPAGSGQDPSPAPSPNGGEGDLAETGTSVAVVSAAAALLLGAGGTLLVRRRRRS